MDKYKNEDLTKISSAKWQLLTASFYKNKDLEKVTAISDFILKADPDIIALVEVGGHESLYNFSKFFLNNNYEVLHFPSNSDRGIDTGFLVKRNKNLSLQLNHYNDHLLKDNKKFSRGLLELQVTTKDQTFYYFLCHLKSKLDLKKEDFEGREQRKREVDFIVETVNKIKKENKDAGVICLGDFNGIIYKDDTEAELLPLINKAKLKDIFEYLNLDLNKRITYIYFNKQSTPYEMQLDYILLDKKASSFISKESFVCDFSFTKDFKKPNSLEEKFKLPSDHYPVYFEFDL